MNVLIIGSGGREHALAWKIAQSPVVKNLYCTPGNPGMAQIGFCCDTGVNNFDALIALAKDKDITLTVVGPEDPLAAGIVDRFEAEGLRIFGPSAAAARLEGSKAFAKGIMEKNGIPTAEYREFDDPDKAIEYVQQKGVPLVIKADGLAAGKGVTVAMTKGEAIDAIKKAMVNKCFGDAGSSIIIEECLVGEEASILAFVDGKNIIPMVASQDHKPAYDGDAGPNTGGMGAYSPTPVVTDALFEEIERTVLRPCVEGMAAEGCPYKGVLYAGLMITETGPKVIEFNCRFGDPETQVILPRMRNDIVPILAACCDGFLDQVSCKWDEGACVSVVMASGGYPKAYEKGKVITGIPEAEMTDGLVVFQAGTKLDGEELLTNGGRVLNVTAMDPEVTGAITKAYEGVGKIAFDDAHYRSDIGRKALERL